MNIKHYYDFEEFAHLVFVANLSTQQSSSPWFDWWLAVSMLSTPFKCRLSYGQALRRSLAPSTPSCCSDHWRAISAHLTFIDENVSDLGPPLGKPWYHSTCTLTQHHQHMHAWYDLLGVSYTFWMLDMCTGLSLPTSPHHWKQWWSCVATLSWSWISSSTMTAIYRWSTPQEI